MITRSARFFVVVTSLFLLMAACQQEPAEETVSNNEPTSGKRLSAQVGPGDTFFGGFPDFGHMVTPEVYDATYTDIPVFQLSQDYPEDLPPDDELPPVLEIDFISDWEAYAMTVREYCFEGNVGSGQIEDDWRPENNSERDWYHIPWLHWGPTGTEGFHGLIFETAVSPFQLAVGQVEPQYIYAITIVNSYGGYTLGQMWADPLNPDRMATDRRGGGGFPVGTVFCKLLLTTAPTDQVDYLENPIEWTAYILANPEIVYSNPEALTRKVGTVRLLQMDWMVRDDRAEETGWVMGTFVYNGTLDNDMLWDNLVPLGLQWGNDPENTENRITPYPALETFINPDLEETIINPSEDVPPMHLGWNGRLNGPADLNTSSCMACHGIAEFPMVTPLVAPGMVPAPGAQPAQLPPSQGGSDAWMVYFQNYGAATAVDPDYATSTDFSLQVGMSLANFYAWVDQQVGGEFAQEYEQVVHPINRGGQ